MLTVPIKLVRFLLQACSRGRAAEPGLRIRCPYTHEEIGLYLGLSSETVVSYLADLKSLELVEHQGSMIVVPNLRALETYAEQTT